MSQGETPADLIARYPPKPNALDDPEYVRWLAEARRLRKAGEPQAVWGKAQMCAMRRKAALNRAWRQSLPKEQQVEQRVTKHEGGADPLDTGTIDRTIWLVSEWSPRGVQLLMRLAEGERCACCKACKIPKPDLRAITALTSLLQDAIKLRVAQMDARRSRKERKETFEIGWADEGELA